jgi:hypothetical protein
LVSDGESPIELIFNFPQYPFINLIEHYHDL